MKMKITLCFLMAVLLLSLRSISAQCNHASVQSSSYQAGDCNNLYFQGSIGGLVQTYGSCGNLFFTPPLTGGNQTTSTYDIGAGQVTINPNPVLDYLEIDPGVQKGTLMVELVNATGQSTGIRKNIDSRATIDVSTFTPGLYFVIIWQEGKNRQIKKFIKIN
jgi:hypothetical protein